MKRIKYIISIIGIFAVIGCNSQKMINEVIKRDVTIIKIDSIENVYVYYANSSDKELGTFRILSKNNKKKCSAKKQIAVGKTYEVSLIDLIIPNLMFDKNFKAIEYNGTKIYLWEDNLASYKLFDSNQFNGKCYK